VYLLADSLIVALAIDVRLVCLAGSFAADVLLGCFWESLLADELGALDAELLLLAVPLFDLPELALEVEFAG